MQPDVSAYMYAWYVWGAIFVFGTFLMTFIGTWIIIKKRKVGRMSPQYIPVPTPTTAMIVSGVIALGILLLLSAILGALGKKKWQSFDEYLVGHRDIGPDHHRRCSFRLLYFGLGFLRKYWDCLYPWIFRDVVCRDMESCRHHSLHLAGID